MHTRPCLSLPTALLLMLAAFTTRADSVQLSGFWYDGVAINSFADGRIVFLNPGGNEVSEELIKLQAIKVAAIPQVEQGDAALAAGDAKAAAAAFEAALPKARPDWLKQYLNWKLTDAYNQLNDGPKAVRAYLALVNGKADPFFLENPPLKSVAQSSDQQKARIVRQLTNARRRAAPAAQAVLDELIAAAQAEPAEAGDPAGAAAAPEAAASAVVLPKDVTEDDPVAELLRAGKFAEARAEADQQLLSSGNMSEKLYLHGRALLALADASDDEALYKSAGLSFVRVMVYFPKSLMYGPSVLELGYIHDKIGRPDKARELYDRATIEIDEEADPDYHQRLMKLTGADSS